MIKLDYKNPSYKEIFADRAKRLQKIRSDPSSIPLLKEFYANNYTQFITDWGCTFDPRKIDKGLPSIIPFILFDRQIEWIDWALELRKNSGVGVTEKSREMGVTWLSVAFACATCIFSKGAAVGFGSRKQDYVDRLGDLDAILPKAREFIRLLPIEFRGGCNVYKDAPYMKINFPETGSMITGQSGAGLGRGGRKTIFFVDEAGFLENPEETEKALSYATECRIDISTANGTNNPFYYKTQNPNIPKFTFHWRDDPRKDDAWYEAQKIKISDPVIIAQELDLDYSASIDGIVIPVAWIQSAIDSHTKLGIEATGIKQAALDIADEGKDLNAFAGRHGILLEHIESWSGKNLDIYKTVEKSIGLCIALEYNKLIYDADGLGAGARGDARVIKEGMKNASNISIVAFRGSGSVVSPKSQMISGRLNEDLFANAKAQAWWALRQRFLNTYRAVVEKLNFDKDKIISISSVSKDYMKLVTELSQPTYSLNNAGKIVIDKSPDGARSPNLADAAMMLFNDNARGFFSV